MGPTANSWSCPLGQILQDEEEEELSLAQIRDKRPHILHFQRQRDLPHYTCAERLLEGQKGRRHHPIVGDVNPSIGVFARIHLG